MTKESGLGMTVTIDDSGGTGRDISNDITNLTWSTPRGVQDTTGLDKSAMERLLLLADFSVTLNGVFNDASNMSFDVFKTVSSTSVARTSSIAISGQTLAPEALYNECTWTRAATGEMTWSATGQLQSGTAPTWA